jgi:dienelactone hydrolase
MESEVLMASEGDVVYICHPSYKNSGESSENLKRICRWFAKQGYLPLASQIYLSEFLDEPFPQEKKMDLSRRLIALADELLVFGEPTATMKEEIAEANRIGTPVVHVLSWPECKHPEGKALGVLIEELT